MKLGDIIGTLHPEDEFTLILLYKKSRKNYYLFFNITDDPHFLIDDYEHDLHEFKV